MATETERKFLVPRDFWYSFKKPAGKSILQGYIIADPDKTVRVRIYGDDAFITIKGPVEGISRPEFEYPVPVEDAKILLEKFCTEVIDKVRYRIDYKGKTWEIDEFYGDNDGLVIAEIELHHPDEEFEAPSWVGQEVTGDARYYNSSLAKKPFNSW